eukprot:11169339-Lingulodinium_polyedra.AAC.2
MPSDTGVLRQRPSPHPAARPQGGGSHDGGGNGPRGPELGYSSRLCVASIRRARGRPCSKQYRETGHKSSKTESQAISRARPRAGP